MFILEIKISSKCDTYAYHFFAKSTDNLCQNGIILHLRTNRFGKCTSFFFLLSLFFLSFFCFFFFFCACNRKIYDSNKYSFNRCDDVTIKTVVVEIDLANALFADYRADNQQSYKFTPSLLIFDLVTKKKKKKNVLQSST